MTNVVTKIRDFVLMKADRYQDCLIQHFYDLGKMLYKQGKILYIEETHSRIFKRFLLMRFQNYRISHTLLHVNDMISLVLQRFWLVQTKKIIQYLCSQQTKKVECSELPDSQKILSLTIQGVSEKNVASIFSI